MGPKRVLEYFGVSRGRELLWEAVRFFFWWVLVPLIGLVVVGLAISAVRPHWRLASDILFIALGILVVAMDWLRGFWNDLGLEGHLFVGGLVTLWAIARLLSEDFARVGRGLDALDRRLKAIEDHLLREERDGDDF